MIRDRNKWIKLIIPLLIFIYGVAMLMIYFQQETLLFPTTSLDAEYQFEFQHDFEEIWVSNDDGAKLHGIHFKQANPKGVILYFHGNAGNLQRWGVIVESLLQYNYDVVVMDYRGYGKSLGKRSYEAMYLDADLFYDYCKQFQQEEHIVVYGRSLGCTFASWVSSRHQPKHLILEAPFYNLSSIVQKYYWFLPTSQLMKFRFNTNEFIKEVNCPSTFIHGTDDLVVPYDNGERLFKLANNSNRITIEGGKHNDLTDYKIYWESLSDILQ